MIRILLLCCLTLAVQAATIIYTADNGIIANPERGYWAFNSNNFGSQGLPSPLSDMTTYLSGLRTSRGVTTVVCTYGLSQWKTTAQLPQNVIDLVDADFATARANGFKLIPRFNYCLSSWDVLGVFPPPPGWDATPAIMVGHLAQFKPIFVKNVDVMALGGLGMYGFWGEQWGTENTSNINGRYADANDNTRQIFAAMLDAVPRNRMILMRYMPTVRQLLGDAPCPESEAFTGTDRSRVGHYNDCFLAEGSSEFNADEGPWSYTSVQGSYTPDLAVDMSCASGYTDQLVIDNLDKQHFDFASLDNGNLSGVTLGIIDRNVGCRYRLVAATIPDAVKPGNTMSLSIDVTNDGYGNIFNARNIEIVLRNQSGGAKYILNVIGDDTVRGNRLYLPRSHETKTLSMTGGIPAEMPEGNYDVIINLPDPYPSIHDRPEYSIHLANTGVWETATGYNMLNHAVQVSSSAMGTVYSGADWFGLNGVTPPSTPTITTQPANQSVAVGATAIFSVTATGTPAPTYQWQKNNTNINSATGANYTTPATISGDNGATYRCVVTNSAGTATSTSATLTVTAVVVVVPPTPAAPAVSVAGTATPTLSGTSVAGATINIYDGATLIGTVTANGSGAWTFSPTLTPGTHQITTTATNSAGTSAASPAISVVIPSTTTAPTVTTQPVNQSVASGATATFSVTATGTPAPTYQWQRNNANVASATSASYTTPATVIGDNGATYRCVVTNSAGTVTSTSATLSVTAVPAPTPAPVTSSSNGKSCGMGSLAALGALLGFVVLLVLRCWEQR